MRTILAACAALATAACATVELPEPVPDPALYATAGTPPLPGAIYAEGGEISLFEDPRARRIGDLVTIALRESTSASKSATTKTQKDSSTEIPGPTILGRPVTANGTPILENSVEAQREFDGSGSSSQSNRLTGNLTAVVVARLPNGNLVLRGEKWLRLNQGDEFVRVTGVVRPVDIGLDNVVGSDRVADARISYGGRGVLANANKPGWLDRFFNSPVMPF
ncbi:MAG TPA: flagellar basal body L-ring protein FlgH [Solirubrobacteraceae bacterium]|nr:flagellar basal body L-ring protein FlgH [Solirubrobacteraceae bacterium]